MKKMQPFYNWRPHPWHGLEVGPNPPSLVNAYIEITPFDLVKYEVDKETGYIRVDRPQRTSSVPPTLYGFIPRTYCGERVHALSPKSTRGDGDPLDICVISERPITHNEVILNACVVGALQMLDGGEADDKIIAVLENDPVWGEINQLSELPQALIDRLQHYFTTYKLVPGEQKHVSIEAVLDSDHGRAIVAAAIGDYDERYGE
ncbi:MAG: inorganic pyrophosphatase [Anaerolineales bacterium]|jgi:inorganic pyrophosphatase